MSARPISERTRNYARKTVLGFHNIELKIVRMNNLPTLNETTGLIQVSYDTSYHGFEGTGRFWLSNDGLVTNVAEGDYSTVSTYISIEWDAEPVPELDDYVQITSAYDDPQLAGKMFRIVGVDGGGFMRAARRMRVTAVTENRDTRGPVF
jgi:hypothetical protein